MSGHLVSLRYLYFCSYSRQIDGDVLGTYTRLLGAPAFWFLNVLVVAATLWPDMLLRLLSDKWGAKLVARPLPNRTVFSTHM